MTTALVSHVKLCYDLACATPATTSHSLESLHLAYLDTFVEYLTPSKGSPSMNRPCRHGANVGDAVLLRAQAQGVRDAVAVEQDGGDECGTLLPRNLADFKDVMGFVDETAKVVN